MAGIPVMEGIFREPWIKLVGYCFQVYQSLVETQLGISPSLPSKSERLVWCGWGFVAWPHPETWNWSNTVKGQIAPFLRIVFVIYDILFYDFVVLPHYRTVFISFLAHKFWEEVHWGENKNLKVALAYGVPGHFHYCWLSAINWKLDNYAIFNS